MKTIYLLEDDINICELIECSLELLGVEFKYYNTVKDFGVAVEKVQPDIAILDVMLPDGNGFDVLKDIKNKYPNTICIMLSALQRESDKVNGLNLGADDYVTKPFSVLELIARIKVALRRVSSEEVLKAQRIELNLKTYKVTLDGKELDLNNKEFTLLKYLMSNKEKVLTREELLSKIWGYEAGETRTVDNHVARLRKLGIDGIETVFGVGYKFTEEL